MDLHDIGAKNCLRDLYFHDSILMKGDLVTVQTAHTKKMIEQVVVKVM